MKLYTVEEIAQQLNISHDHAYDLVFKFEPIPKRTSPQKHRLCDQQLVNQIKNYYDLKTNWYKPKQAGDKLNASSKTMYKLAVNKKNKIPMKIFNKVHYFKKSEIDKLAEEIKRNNLKNTFEIQKEFKISKNELSQLVKKYDIKTYQLIGNGANFKHYSQKDFKRIKTHIENLKGKRSRVTKNRYENKPLDLSQNTDYISIATFAKNTHISRKKLYPMIEKNKIIAYRDVKTAKLYLTKKTAKYIKENYLNYPNHKLYTTEEVVHIINEPAYRIQNLMNKTHLKYIHILGDSKSYLTELDIQIIQKENLKSPRKKKHPQPIDLITNCNNQPNPNDLSINQVAIKLHAKHNHVRNWANHNRIPYQYNGTEIFFTPEQVNIIKKAYLNYPNEKLYAQKDIQSIFGLTSNAPKLKRICKKLDIKPYHILGDTRTLYTESQKNKLNDYLMNFE